MPTRLEYTVKKILASAKGNRQLAQRSLIETALDDEMLLRELVAPFLKAIASQAIDRELSSSSPATPRATVSNIGLGNVAKKAVPADLRAGYDPMRAAKNIPQDLGKRPEASPRHVSTMKLLAAAFQVKRRQGVV